jgi:beta-lactamase regulating signal transducer with metallopeptidase domain
MNFFEGFRRLFALASQNPLLERLLVASLELIAVTALVLAVIHIARMRSNRVIALLWLVALGNLVVGLALGDPAPLFDFGSLAVVPAAPAPMTPGGTSGPVAVSAARATVRGDAAIPPVAEGAVPERSILSGIDPSRSIVGVWLAGVGLLALLSIADRLRIRRLVSTASAPPAWIGALYTKAATGMHREKLPRLVVTDRLESPAIAGTFFPVIFLPLWMTRKLDRERVVWSLRHELTHWRHRDQLAGFVGEVARILFFFHPLVWWIGNRWKEASEIACDQAMVGSRREARHYAEQLYQMLTRVHTRRQIMVTASLFATRTQIGKRIELLLKSRPAGKPRRRLPATVFLLAFTALVFTLGAEISPQAEPTRIVVKKDDEKSKSVVTTIHEDDDRNITVVTRGKIEWNDDKTGVVGISPEGSIHIVDTKNGVERELEVLPGEAGELVWKYKVDGENHLFDDEAKEWFASCIQYFSYDETGDFVLITRPNIKVRSPLIVKTRPNVTVQIDEDDDAIYVDEDDDVESVIELRIDDGEDAADVWIRSSADMKKSGDHVEITLSAGGKLLIEVKKGGDSHLLEIVPGKGDSRKYIYKLNGEKRPYDDDAKKIFEKYLEHLEDGYKLYPGERI